MPASRNKIPTFGNKFKPIVADLIKPGKSNYQILQHLRETHSISISKRTLTQRKADWGLSHHSIQQTNHLEGKICHYFHQACSNSQIHDILSKKHNYVYSQQTLERKIQQMKLKRQQEDLHKDDEEGMAIIIQCVQQIHETPEGRNVGYCKLKLLQTTGSQQ
jgi:hypothetical protein